MATAPQKTGGRVLGVVRATSSDVEASTTIRDSPRHEAMRRAARGRTPNAYAVMVAGSMSEVTWSAQIVALAQGAGFLRNYHTNRSDRSDPGFPDLVMIHATQPRMIYMEVKSHTGKLTTDQVGWLDDLSRCRDSGATCIEVYGAVRPLQRDALVKTLFPSADLGGRPLHEWCLDQSCEHCQHERTHAKPSRSKTRQRIR